METKDIEELIKKSGHNFEYDVIKLLEDNNWSTMSGRYYIDDNSNVPREMDIIGYIVSKVEYQNLEIHVYTALIISCKSSEKYKWLFMTRPVNSQNKNYNFYPFHSISNNSILQDFIDDIKENNDKRKNWIDDKKLEVLKSNYKNTVGMIQFDDEYKSNKKSQDKDIYSSIETLIKSLEFEKRQRYSKNKLGFFYYDFNLLSIFDNEILEYDLKDKKLKNLTKNDFIYLNEHIVYNKPNFYRVHFINFKQLENYLKKYSQIHQHNCGLIKDKLELFYDSIFNVSLPCDSIKPLDKIKHDIIDDNMLSEINHLLNQKFNLLVKVDDIKLGFDKESTSFVIDFDNINGDWEKICVYLNSQEYLIKKLKKRFQTYFYEDHCIRFDFILPF